MIRKGLPLLRFLAIVALSVLACACKNDASSLEFIQASAQSRVSAGEEDSPASDRLNRMAKQGLQKPRPAPEAVEAGLVPIKLVKKGKAESPLAPVRHTKTKMVEFENGPFPYHGVVPSTERPFLDVNEDGRRGHRTFNGNVYWEDKTYSDRRTLLHVPRGFDVRRPALMVVFLHGHGATLQRDVIERQRVPEQVSESGVNAVLVAPQLASDAANSRARQIVGAWRFPALPAGGQRRAG